MLNQDVGGRQVPHEGVSGSLRSRTRRSMARRLLLSLAAQLLVSAKNKLDRPQNSILYEFNDVNFGSATFICLLARCKNF